MWLYLSASLTHFTWLFLHLTLLIKTEFQKSAEKLATIDKCWPPCLKYWDRSRGCALIQSRKYRICWGIFCQRSNNSTSFKKTASAVTCFHFHLLFFCLWKICFLFFRLLIAPICCCIRLPAPILRMWHFHGNSLWCEIEWIDQEMNHE